MNCKVDDLVGILVFFDVARSIMEPNSLKLMESENHQSDGGFSVDLKMLNGVDPSSVFNM